MNRKKVYLSAGIILAVFLTFGFQNSSDHKVLFEKAKFTMETKGDLEGAIKLSTLLSVMKSKERPKPSRLMNWL
jgi:hypothetical protein